jgi:Leucine-rich repeat (LRR) protein
LTDLVWLRLENNNIQNIVPLWNLSDLEYLFLGHNNIGYIGSLVANPGIDAGDYVSLRANPLGDQAIETDIPTLQDRGVTVDLYPPVEDLITAVRSLVWITVATRNRLIPHLEAADGALDKENELTAIRHLSIFIEQCEMMRGTQHRGATVLTEESADYLILYAEDMIEAIQFINPF